MLKSSLEQILNGTNADEKLAESFFNHPQIKLLQEKLNKLPSYVPSANFAMSVMDIVSAKSTARTGDLFNDFKAGIGKFVDAKGDLPTLFKTWADNSDNVKELKDTIEKWFNEYMDRVSGWYKEKHRFTTRIIAIAVALVFHLDMIKITETIHGDPLLKAALVAEAEKTVDNPDAVKRYMDHTIQTDLGAVDEEYDVKIKNDSANKPRVDSLEKSRDSTKNAVLAGYNKKQYDITRSLISSVSVDNKLLFGWEHWPFQVVDPGTKQLRTMNALEIALMLLGLFIGAVGIAMGAPFWFDLMMKLVNIRRAGIKPKKNE
jgi:hypothetical protein